MPTRLANFMVAHALLLRMLEIRWIVMVITSYLDFYHDIIATELPAATLTLIRRWCEENHSTHGLPIEELE